MSRIHEERPPEGLEVEASFREVLDGSVILEGMAAYRFYRDVE